MTILDHVNIVAHHETFVHDGQLIVAMELCEVRRPRSRLSPPPTGSITVPSGALNLSSDTQNDSRARRSGVWLISTVGHSAVDHRQDEKSASVLPGGGGGGRATGSRVWAGVDASQLARAP